MSKTCAEPIPVKGKLNFWSLGDDLPAQIDVMLENLGDVISHLDKLCSHVTLVSSSQEIHVGQKTPENKK